MTFRVGQKVVCVDDSSAKRYSPWFTLGDMDGLTKGTIYTVRRTGTHGGLPCIWLNEIIRPVRGTIGAEEGECGYAPERFRLVAERKTDISIFTKILDDVTRQRVAAE